MRKFQTLSVSAVSALALAGMIGSPVLAAGQSTVPMAASDASHGSQDLGPVGDSPNGSGTGGDVGSGYDNGQGYNGGGGGYNGSGDGRDMGPPPGSAQRGYDAPPPAPPAGYNRNAATRPQDREYARAYARWQQDRAAYDYSRCVRKHRTGTAVGAVLGGIAGAVLGSNAAPRWDRSGGAFAGGAIGAVAGGAIGSSTGPVCPPPYGYGPGPGYGYGVYGPAAYGPGFYGPGYYGAPVVVGGPVITYRVGPRWGWHRGYWRRW